MCFIYIFYLYDSVSYAVVNVLHLYICIACVVFLMYCIHIFVLHIRVISAFLVLNLHYITVFVLHLYSYEAYNLLCSVLNILCWTVESSLPSQCPCFCPLLHHGKHCSVFNIVV